MIQALAADPASVFAPHCLVGFGASQITWIVSLLYLISLSSSSDLSQKG